MLLNMMLRLKRMVDSIAGIVAVIAALNFALAGLFGFNPLRYVAGQNRMREQVAYGIVGLAAFWFGTSLIQRGAPGGRPAPPREIPHMVWKLVPAEEAMRREGRTTSRHGLP